MEDELAEARDHLYAFNYSKCLELLDQVVGASDLVQVEKDALKSRSYLGLGSMAEIKQMQASDNPALKATAYAAVYLRSSNDQQRAIGRDKLCELQQSTKDPAVLYLTACVLAFEEQYLEAYQLLKDTTTPDVMALRSQLLLLLDRPDLAEQEQNRSPDGGDSAAGKVVSSVLQMANGNFQEAFLTYSDLQSQYWTDTDSAILTGGRAAANLHRGMYQEAEEDVQRALQLDPNCALSLANAASLSVHVQKFDEFDKYMGTLCQKHPMHPLAKKSVELDQALQRFAASH
jgi:tetratricopeptide (TPR) repeat protein